MTIRLWRAVLQLPGQRVAASRDAARGARPAPGCSLGTLNRCALARGSNTRPRHAPRPPVRCGSRCTRPSAGCRRAPRLLRHDLLAETLSLIGLTSSVQQNVDICISGLSASGGQRTTCCRLLWRAPRNRERSIPAQCSLVAALCCSEVPYHTVGPAQRSAVAKASRFVHVSHQKRDFRAISAQNRRRSGPIFLQVLATRSSPPVDLGRI